MKASNPNSSIVVRRPLLLTRRSLVCGLAIGCAFGNLPALAQERYPTRPIKIVLPIPAGTALDVVTRVVGDNLARQLEQPIVVENRPGAGGQIAAQAVSSAPNDGYTLLGGASSIWTILPAQKKGLPFDVTRDFVQIGMIVASGPMYIAVSPKLGVNSFAELIALAKAKPGQIVFGTNGAGSLPHLAALALAKQAAIPINVVPYTQGGTVAVIADIMGGRAHATIEAIFGLRGQVQSGDIKLLAVMSPERDPVSPDVPTAAATVPGVDAVGFMSLAAPAGAPAPVVERLAKALAVALEAPEIKRRFADLGIHAKSMTPAETNAFIQAQEKSWWPLVREFEPK
jgi:tripartite-type tricarboxylate transporter receptor subunit TctC